MNFFDKIQLKPLVLVFVLAFCGSGIVGVLSSYVFAAIYTYDNRAMTLDELHEILRNSTIVYVYSLVIFVPIMVASGYLIAKLCKEYELYNAVTLGIVVVLVSVLQGGMPETPIWYLTATAAVAVPACYIGAHFGKKKKDEEENDTINT